LRTCRAKNVLQKHELEEMVIWGWSFTASVRACRRLQLRRWWWMGGFRCGVLVGCRDAFRSMDAPAPTGTNRMGPERQNHMRALILISVWCLCAAGCASVKYSKVATDGTKVDFKSSSLFSTSALKGLTVEGVTKTTTNGLRITSSTTEPQPESITATGEALGNMIGAAAAAAAKGVVK